MIDFSKDWGQEIAEISTRPEYQTGRVRITSSDIEDQGVYDIDTGEWSEGMGTVILYEGQARFVPIRWGVDARDTHLFNASTTTRLRVQVPESELPDEVPRGSLVTILEAPFAPHMVGATSVVVGGVQNSSNGSRNLETEWNSDLSKKRGV